MNDPLLDKIKDLERQRDDLAEALREVLRATTGSMSIEYIKHVVCEALATKEDGV